ncbi:GFA family protein [Ahrensia sp. AH-315-G08]|nr:GFA family protein [Ahrensia sp. AH-315-G08]
MAAKGSCLCGGVSYSIDGPLRDVVACHCQQCRKQSGHFYAATDAQDTDLTIEDGGSLTWYAASDEAKRGFCKTCGSALFWKSSGSTKTSILAGSLDGDPGIKLERHIFCADKGAYYEIEDGVQQFAQGDVGARN